MGGKIYLRRFLALFLCLVLAFVSSCPVASATDPVTATLAVTGGQLAAGGLAGEAGIAALGGPVAAVVGVTLGVLGINAYVSKRAQETGKTRTRFVLDSLILYAYQIGTTKDALIRRIANGISVSSNGLINLSKDAAKVIYQFGNALVSTGSVSQDVPNSLVINGVAYPMYTSYSVNSSFSNGLTAVAVNTTSIPTVSSKSSSELGYRFYALEPFTVSCDLTFSNGEHYTSSYSSTQYGDLYAFDMAKATVAVWHSDNGVDDYGVNSISPLSYDGYLYPVLMDYGASLKAHDEVFTGSTQDWVDNKDVLNPSAEDTPIVVNPDLLNPIIDSLTEGKQATMDILSYLDALTTAFNQSLEDVKTGMADITDTLTGLQEQIAIPNTAVENPTVTNPSVTPETTPILNPSEVDPGTVVTGFSFDLTEIFPFCIPFDIYAMLETLSATPEAPNYHVHYEGPYNIVIDFTVDLSAWDSVAAVLRTVELLAFCIGLAYVTRSMFIRS